MTAPLASCEEYEFPLSAQQTRLWIIEKLDPGNAAYHVPITLRIFGDLRVDALLGAIQSTVDRHETLRTRFDRNAQIQLVAAAWTVSPEVVDLSGRTEPDRAAELARIKRDVARRPFDLWSAPPLRVALVRLGPAEHVLLVVVHHIACDGWSVGVLAAELSAAYAALCAGRAPRLPELTVQYGDFALWQRDRLRGEPLRAGLVHWAAALAGAPLTLNLPTDRPRPAQPTFDGGRVRLVIDRAQAARIEAFASASGVSVFMTLLAAYATVLARLSDQDTVVVGTATAGRTRPELSNLVGCFIDVLPLRVDVSSSDTVAGLLARVRQVCLDAYAHQDLPFERLVEHLHPERDLARGPIFQVMLNLHDTPAAELSWPGLHVTGEPAESGVAKYDLTLDAHLGPAGLTLDIEFNQDVFLAATVSRIAARVRAVLAWYCAAGPDAALTDVDVTTAAERRLAEAAAGPVAAVGHEPAQVRLPAGDERSAQVATALAGRGVGRGDPVGVLLAPGEARPVITGVWHRGAVAVPLDPALAPGRLGSVLDGCGIRLVLTSAELADRLPASGPPIVLVEGLPAAQPLPPVAVTGEDPALIVYETSGGRRPAGLVVPHRAKDVEGGSIVLDARMRPVPSGTVGEVFVGGPAMPVGYHRRPGLTAERFVPSVLTHGGRLHRTGVLARLAADGTVSPVGERVSVRGHRVYLGEIAAALAGHPSVRDAAVDLRDGRLVAYVVGGETAVLRDRLRDLPAYLIPAIVAVSSIPRDGRGRLDRDALRPPEGAAARRRVQPRDATEAMVLDCFRRVLGRPRLALTDDFFDHGGSSISATRALVELEQAGGRRLSLRELFQTATAEAVSARLRPPISPPISPPIEDAHCPPLHPRAWCPGHVLVTAAAGPVDFALIERLLADPGTEVTVLVEAASDRDAMGRFRGAAEEFDVELDPGGDRLHVLAGSAGTVRLGLPADAYAGLADEVAAVYHASPRGIGEVVRFATTGAGKALHYLRELDPSTVDSAGPLAETPSGDADEEIVYRAACRGLPVTILRRWPADLLVRHLTAVLRSARLPDLPDLPDLPGAQLRALPADQLADAMVRIGRNAAADGQVVHLVGPPAGLTVPYLRRLIARLERGAR